MCPLYILVLLSVSSSGAKFGEYCHGWTGNSGVWNSGFQCPDKNDHVEATYCCGFCNVRYCCISSDARLDQGQCPNEVQGDKLGEGAPSVEVPAAAPAYLPFVVVGSVFVSFVFVGAMVGVFSFKCLRTEEETRATRPAPRSRFLELEPSTDASRDSSSSSNSVSRASRARRPQTLGAPGAENLYRHLPQAFPIMGCPPNAHFLHAAPAYLQPPYINYVVPGEHTILIAPAPYIDGMSCYSQPTNYLPMTQHIDPLVLDGSSR